MKTLTTILTAAFLALASVPALAASDPIPGVDIIVKPIPGHKEFRSVRKPGASAIYDRWGNLRSGKSGLADFPTRIKATKSLPRGKRGSASSPQ